MEPAVFFSDDLGYLADCLAQNLFLPGSKPFDKRLVIVPNQSTKIFIQRKWAQKDNLGIAAGVAIVEMPNALSSLAAASGKILPSSFELALRLFEEVRNLSDDGLRSYLEGKEERLFPLCQKLARLFLEYGNYGEGRLEEWLQKNGWQARLWKSVFEHGNWTCPLELFASASWDVRPHLFGFYSLPPAYARFFKQCGAHFYLFSPCSHFWGDYLSEKSHAKESLFFQRRGVAERELETFDELVGEQHPLLANWGQAGRQFLEALETEEMRGDEQYAEKDPRTRLQYVQRSILHLDTAPCSVEPDDSLQILAIPSRAREVETLLDVVKTLLQRHEKDPEPFTPGEILVLAPDITQYVPYIQAYFGSEESRLGYTISGIEKIRTSPLAEAFRNLIGLIEKRFDAEALLSLFQAPPFCKKQGWEESDLVQIASWFEKAGITWGYDGAQRARITHAPSPLDERGTVCFGFDRILFGLACEESSLFSPLPLLGWTDADLFGQVVQVAENLQRDLETLNSPKTLAAWTKWTGEIFDHYFSSDEENWLLDALLRLARSSSADQMLSFTDFCRIADDILARKNGHTPKADLQAVRFASLSEGEVLPARMICLLGMEEGSFPRSESHSSLAEVPLQRLSSSVYDRYLFLEALLKAGEYLWISYLNRSPEEKIETMPSIVVQEFSQWLKKFFPSSESFKTEVPSLGISKEALHLFPYFSTSRYKAAQLYYGIEKSGLALQIPTELPPDAWPEEYEIPLEDLCKCLGNSLGFYFSKVLRVPLKREEDEDFEQEEFSCPTWTMRSLAMQCLTAPMEQVVAKAKLRGEFPMGEFEKVAYVKLEEKNKELCEKFDFFGVDPLECFPVVLSRCCIQPKRLENGTLLLPAWELVFGERKFYVTGQIEMVSPQGLVCYAKDKAPELFPYWPQYLVLAGHPALQSIPPVLLPVGKENKKEDTFVWQMDPREEMGKLILYMQKAKTLVSPFNSKLFFDFFTTFEAWEKKIGDAYDLYSVWLMKQQGPDYAKALYGLWQPYLQNAFRTFFTKFEKKEEPADV